MEAEDDTTGVQGPARGQNQNHCPGEGAGQSQGLGLGGSLSMLAVATETVSDLFDVVGGMTRTVAMLDGLRAEAIGQAMAWFSLTEAPSAPGMVRSKDLRLRSLRAELACALRIPERTAEAMLVTSEALVTKLPGTLATLKSGEISYRHAQAMVEQSFGMTDEATAALEDEALPWARVLTVAKLTRKLRVLREELNPESIAERNRQASECREVRLEPAEDGMAWVSAHLPAPEATGIFNRLTAIAKTLQSKDETRTLTQLRADVFCDLLIDGEPTEGARGIRPKVFVTVPVLTLLGVDQTPTTGQPPIAGQAPATRRSPVSGPILATLDGYGPIDPETARSLAGRATSFIRLLTHPETGAVLSVGRDSYTVPQDLKNWLQLRDGSCRFPGCATRASRSDIDHTYDWDWGGGTRHDNLAHLCKSHHILKHKTPWKVTHADPGDGGSGSSSTSGGVLTWTSPTGRNYTTHPEIRLRT